MLKNTLIIAHRGASGSAPENTLSAFVKAVEAGADMIELDVHQTKDGVVVCIHDEDLSRTTSGNGKVNKFTFNELQNFDAGIKFNEKFKGEKIPSLEEVLKQIKLPLLIEIKKGEGYYHGIENKIFELLKKYDLKNQCVIQSFESSVLDKFRKLGGGIELHKLVTGNIPIIPLHIDNKLKTGSITKYSKFPAINPNYRFISKKLVNKLHHEGKKIFTWTVNNESDMLKMVQYGVDGIITNYPEQLVKILGNQ